MNKKGRNKKGNKPPNPSHNVLVQSEKNVEVPSEDVVECVREERVPEIVSEVAAPVIEKKEEDEPKKPKRNKGKKKKDNDDNFSVAKEVTEESAKHEDVAMKFENVTKEEPIDENPIETATIAPTARKKKNKKKTNETFGAVMDQSETLTKEDVSNAPVSETEIKHDSIDMVVNENERKQSKKYNKKKNRNDSEKSEKDEILSCTTAFQKLVDSKDLTEEKPEYMKLSIKDDQIIQNKPSVQVADETRPKFTQEVISARPEFPETTPNEEQTITEVSKCENMNKKKNKKDKKQQSIKTEGLSESHTDEGIIAPKDCKIEIRKDVPYIAKPVDMSPKVKHKASTSDEITENFDDLNAIKIEESVTQAITPDCKSLNIKEEKVIDALNSPIMTELNKQIECGNAMASINIPDNTMGKKRKKGPKIPKPNEIDNQIQESRTESKEFDLIQLGSSVEAASSHEKYLTSDNVPLVAYMKPEVEVVPELFKTNENISKSITEITADVSTDKATMESKPIKKRKKFPKLPIKSDEVSEDKELRTDLNTKESTKPKDDNSRIPTEIPKSDDVEIHSLKTDESEGSGSEVTPEVLCPRATSQQLIDDNNNIMVIREIFTAEPNIASTDTPSSIDTPKTPELTRKCKDSKMVEKDGKTDLKSKMMEVNLDMEGLRQSIEKSLAEFTAIEKSEEKLEKKFENVQLKTTEVTIVPDTSKVSPNEDLKNIQSDEATSKPQMVGFASSDPMIDVSFENIESKTKPQDDEIQFMEQSTKIDNTDATTSCDGKITYDTSKMEAVEHIAETKIPEDENQNIIVPPPAEILASFVEDKKDNPEQIEASDAPQEQTISQPTADTPSPVYPARKDNKGKHKKTKGKQDSAQATTNVATASSSTNTGTIDCKDKQVTKTEENKNKTANTSDTKEKGKQQASHDAIEEVFSEIDYEPIDNFEDALTSSNDDDVKITFDMIVTESNEQTNPKINIIEPDEEKQNPVKPPKNLLGHPDIPARSNRRDYKKEKDKIPNETQAKVKLKDSDEIVRKQSKNTQTDKKMIKDLTPKVDNDEFVYKYSFRKVFLQSSCHVCKKDLIKTRVPCGYCNLLFYCSNKHKDEDWPQHQALCFAVSTLVHLKDQKHIYTDTKSITGHEYRLVRMQMIVSCEKVLKRRLVPWEQEALLYPRMCSNSDCREWRQGRLADCEGCRQISYCSEHPDHLPKSHQRWCKSYSLYQKLVCYQQTKGRLEPKLPTKVMQNQYQIAEQINEVLASMYEEKIDMNDIQYAALTQIATAPLTAACCHQIYRNKMNSIPSNGVSKKASFTIHVVGAELQFEADALNKWEVFFLHLRPDLRELRVVLINHNLNPSNLPLDLLGKIKLCENCLQNKRRVLFSFQDKRTYPEYRSCEDFIHPDLVCAFNPSIQRSSIYNGQDPWPASINTILKLKTPFLITAYTMTELQRDAMRVKECSEVPFDVISEPRCNSFASVRPDRNFISDDEIPLLFKNFCFLVMSG